MCPRPTAAGLQLKFSCQKNDKEVGSEYEYCYNLPMPSSGTTAFISRWPLVNILNGDRCHKRTYTRAERYSLRVLCFGKS